MYNNNEAYYQYEDSLKRGKKQFFSDRLHRLDGYIKCLDEIIKIYDFSLVKIGLVNVPEELIVGTKTSGRKIAFASNFMPLLKQGSEFSAKWMRVCNYHLSDSGISEAPVAYEYLGKFYIEEGNKRVSVLKSYGAVYIECQVIRVLPLKYDTFDYQLYKEFIDFYELSNLYLVQFHKLSYYKKLQKLMMFEEDYKWNRNDRITFAGLYERIRDYLIRKKLDVDYCDSLLVLLEIYGYKQLQEMDDKTLNKAIEESKRRMIYDTAHLNILCVADEEDNSLWNGVYNKELKNYDLIISAGDLKANYLEYLVTMSNKQLLYVHGNHDDKYDIKPPEGCDCIDDKIEMINGVRILGLGGSYRYKQGSAYMYSEAEMAKRIKKLKRKIKKMGGIDIVVAHAPVKGYGDLDDYAHQGFECFVDLIKEYKPKYFIYGHVHARYDVSKKTFYNIGETQIINASGKQRIVF